MNGVALYSLPPGVRPSLVRPTARPFLADYQLVIGGVTRSFRLFVPTGLRGPAPVVVAMTGYTLTGDADSYMHIRELAQRKHFVVLEPRGYGASYNAGLCCGAAVRDRIDDRGALTTMLSSVNGAYPINRHRIYMVGFSNGGMMAYDYACRFPRTVAAIGVVSTAYVSHCTPSEAVPVMHVQGAADGVLPLSGGVSPLLRQWVPSRSQTDSKFRRLDALAGTPQKSVLLPGVDHVWPRLGWQGNYDTTAELWAYLWRYQR